MEIKALDAAPYRKAYTAVLFLCIISVAGSFFIVKQGYSILANEPATGTVKNVIMFAMIGVAVIFSVYQQKQKQKLLSYTNLDEKLAFYQKFFRSRLWWHALTCVVSAFLLYLTARRIFLYFGILDVVVMLLGFPSKLLIKKELNEDDLLVH